MCVALVSLVAGAQPAGAQAQACPEPAFADTYPYATFKQLVPIELTNITPGTEYLLKVDGREVKQGIAESDKVSRKFRMPKLGTKREEARLVLVLANDACENSPWKLRQKMGYRPGDAATEQQKPDTNTTPEPQTKAPTTTPTPTPTPTPAPTPTPTPSLTTPSPKPTNPGSTSPIKPVIPKTQTPTPVTPTEPAKDAKTWLTPLDVFSRGSEPPPQPPASLNPADRQTEDANSTAALLGLGGLFVLIAGAAAIAWTRFRRYDDAQLATLINPDGKLPSMLDANAVDLGAAGMSGAPAVAVAAAGGVSAAAGTNGHAEQKAAIPAAQIKAPIVPPVKNGAVHANGAEVANAASDQAPSYREEVETELQRILQEAGLDTELEGILSDARAEAARRGVPMDSDLMLRALTDETNGSAKLSDSAKGELKQRFQRIAAEERGEVRPAGDQ